MKGKKKKRQTEEEVGRQYQRVEGMDFGRPKAAILFCHLLVVLLFF